MPDDSESLAAIPDSVAGAGWEELTVAFDVKEYPISPALDAIKLAYLRMDRLLKATHSDMAVVPRS